MTEAESCNKRNGIFGCCFFLVMADVAGLYAPYSGSMRLADSVGRLERSDIRHQNRKRGWLSELAFRVQFRHRPA
jgi:hypothetical protein